MRGRNEPVRRDGRHVGRTGGSVAGRIRAGNIPQSQALTWLERACAERSAVLTGLKVNPLLDPLRGDPRFAKLLHCARLD